MSQPLDEGSAPGSPSLNRAVKRGMVWIAIERGGLQFLNLFTSVVLARLLAPAAFGLMGMSGFFTGISSRLIHLGFGAAVIRRPEIRPDHIATLFVATLVINTTICLVLVALSPLAGRYFDNPLVGDVLRWMALIFVLRSIGACPSALLRRRLDFRANAFASFIDAGVKLVVAVPLAWQGYGVWALVYGELAGSLCDKLYLAWAARWVPSLRCSRAALNDLFVFGMNMSLRSIIGYVSEHVDNLIVGKSLGMTALGFYEKSYNLIRLPVSELSGRLGVVIFPALARMQGEPGRFRAAFRKAALGMSLIGYPLFATFAVLGGPLILVLYGAQWAPAIVPFQILAVAGPLRMTAILSSSAVDACGRLGSDVRRRAFTLCIMVPAVFVGIRWGIVGVATAVLLTQVLSFTLLVTLLHRVTPVRAADLLRPQALPLAAVFLLAITEYFLLGMGQSRQWPAVVTLAAGSAAGVLVYAVVVYLFRTEPIVALWNELSADVRQPFLRLPVVRRWA